MVKVDNVARLNVLARAQGMSYGQYQAMLHESGVEPAVQAVPREEPVKTGREGRRLCVICAQALSPFASGRAKTCGEACSYELNKRRMRERYQKNVKFKPEGAYKCAYCGGEFVPNRKCQRFCGIRCQEANKRAVRRGEMVQTGMAPGMANRSYGIGACVICAEQFRKRAARQMTCSAECRKIHAERKRKGM